MYRAHIIILPTRPQGSGPTSRGVGETVSETVTGKGKGKGKGKGNVVSPAPVCPSNFFLP